MKQVQIREFRANLSQLLREEDELELFRGDCLVAKIECVHKGARIIVPKNSPAVKSVADKELNEMFANVKDKTSAADYGCGCKKGVTRLCPKHHRS